MLTKIPLQSLTGFDAGVQEHHPVDSEEALLELCHKEKLVVLSWPLLGTRALPSSMEVTFACLAF